MTLGEFHTLLRDTIKRGDSLDESIPQYVAMAVRFIERNYTFKYMEHLASLQMVEGDRVVELTRYYKKVEFVRFTPYDTISDYTYLHPTEARQIVRPSTGAPAELFLLGTNKLIFNPIPDTAYSGEVLMVAYTDWPTALDSRHYLLDIAPDLLLGQTAMMMAIGPMRDPRMVEGYKLMRDEAIKTLETADDELRYGGADLRMGYSPYYPS